MRSSDFSQIVSPRFIQRPRETEKDDTTFAKSSAANPKMGKLGRLFRAPKSKKETRA